MIETNLTEFLNQQPPGMAAFWIIVIIVAFVFWAVLTVCWSILPFILIHRLKKIEAGVNKTADYCAQLARQRGIETPSGASNPFEK